MWRRVQSDRAGLRSGQCTPWNLLLPFGYGQAGSGWALDPNVRAYIYLPGQALSVTVTHDYFADLTGSILPLPAGDLAVAMDVEHRKEPTRSRPMHWLKQACPPI